MDFIPLAIWAAGFLFALGYEERTYYQAGWDEEKIKNKTKLCGVFWFYGCLFFLVLGVFGR